MKISAITPKYTYATKKAFGANSSNNDEYKPSQVIPPYISENCSNLIHKFYDSTAQDTSWLRNKPVSYNGVKFSLIDGPFEYLPKAIKAFYPDGSEFAVCKYHDSKNGEVIRYSLRQGPDYAYEQGFVSELTSNMIIGHETYPGNFLSASHSDSDVEKADKYLSRFYSDVLEAYKSVE